jgi:hypothetical protein
MSVILAAIVAVHQVGVAFGGDEVLGGFGFAAGVEGGTRIDALR